MPRDNSGNVFDPALVEQVVGLGSFPDEAALMRQRMQYGQEAAQTPGPEGYRVGGTYIAASPLEHLSSAVQKGMGLAQRGRAMAGTESLIRDAQKRRSAMARALGDYFNRQNAPQQQPVEEPEFAPPQAAAAGAFGTPWGNR